MPNKDGTRAGLPLIFYANIVFNLLVVALPCAAISINIFGLEGTFYDLGRPVQYFAAFVMAVPCLLAIFASLQLLMKKAAGRYISLVLDFVVVVVTAVILFNQFKGFIGMDGLAMAMHQNAAWLLGFPLAYILYAVGGRFTYIESLRKGLQTTALLVAGGALIGLLWFGGITNALATALSAYGDPFTWGATAVLIIAAVIGWQMLHQGGFFNETPAQQEAWQGWLMLSPNIIGFVLFFAGPLLLSFYISFTNDRVGNVPEVIGVRNYTDILSLQFRPLPDANALPNSVLDSGYQELFTVNIGGSLTVIGAKDRLFWYSLRNTMMYCLLLVPLSVLPALGMALLLNSKLPGMKIFRAIYFLPSVAAVVGTALIWRWLYDPLIGVINYVLAADIKWLSDDSIIIFSLVLMGAWQAVGFNTVLFIAGLQGVPRILHEAAYVDGANTIQRFANVTLPLLRPTTFFVIITTAITGLQVFNEPYALIFQRPMPLSATTAVYYLYDRSFSQFEFGYASAVAWILFAVIFSITLIQFRVQNRQGFDSYSGG
jgi:ABC-type sugar transport system permease subunit